MQESSNVRVAKTANERLKREFSGIDCEKTESMRREVIEDEFEMLSSLSEIRKRSSISLETVGFMIGTTGGHLSRYLNRGANMSLMNYLRVARCLGYRCRMQFEKVDDGGSSALNSVAHRRSK